jgi:sugar/nucleoside kinase (ribokinase family)
VPGFAVQTVDATGCGDAFIAGLLWQLVSGGDSHFGPLCWRSQPSARLRQILRYANAVGAITAQTVGVIPALPAAAQVEAFLQQHKER